MTQHLPTKPSTNGRALTIGTFDGVHRGHQALLTHLRDRAEVLGLRPAVITFWPHPRNVLAGGNVIQYLTTLPERLELLRATGVEDVSVMEFDLPLSRLKAREFFQSVSWEKDLQLLIAGENFRVGHNREAGIEEIHEIGHELGFQVEMFPPQAAAGGKISSTRIRGVLLEDGDVRLASTLLGREYMISGTVIQGAGRGRSIGIPTANIQIEDGLLVPLNGVYYCSVDNLQTGERDIGAMVNIGIRPTFDAGPRSVEAHLLDWSGDIYTHTLKVRFHTRLRDERKFENAAALVEQIQRDIAQARTLASP